MRRFALLLAVVTVSAGIPAVSLAQSGFGGSGGSMSGGFGGQSGGQGGGGLGGLAGALGGAGGGGMGGLGGGMGGSGMGGMGGAGMGSGAMGGSPFGQAGTNGQMGQQQGQGQFLGRNTAANNFLGRNTQGATGIPGQGGQQQNGARRGGGNRNGNQANANNQQQGGAMNGRPGASQAPAIRPRQKVNFEYSKPQLAMVSGNLQTRLGKMTSIKATNLNLSVEPSGELVIKGQVSSASEAKLAENLARLEPGVYAVRNELTYPEPVSDE